MKARHRPNRGRGRGWWGSVIHVHDLSGPVIIKSIPERSVGEVDQSRDELS